MQSILLITTADTDLLTAERALSAMPAGFPQVAAINPASLSARRNDRPHHAPSL